MKFRSLLLSLLVVLCVSCEATQHLHSGSLSADTDFPTHIGLINDFDNILSTTQEAKLLELIQQHEQETTNQIVIATLTSIQDYEGLEAYSLDLANAWKIGQEEDNGVLIAIYMKERRIWIHNGVGVMDKLTDSETLDIIIKTIVPEFKKDHYYVGLYKGIENIIAELKP